MVGHSFGARILTGALGLKPVLTRHASGFETNLLATYNFRTNIEGAVYLQPAMSVAEIEQITGFPVFVTQSRHDHLNGVLYPLANLPYNFGSESIDLWLETPFHDDPVYHSHKLFRNIWDAYVGTWAFAYTPPFSALAAASSPIYGFQLEAMQTNHFMLADTLAQLPVIQIPIQQLRTNSGVTSTGLFDAGRYLESAARIGNPHQHCTLECLLRSFAKNSPLVFEPRPFYVDSANVINASGLPYINSNYQTNQWASRTFGWIDPVGSHSDYNHPEIYELIYDVLEGHYHVR